MNVGSIIASDPTRMTDAAKGTVVLNLPAVAEQRRGRADVVISLESIDVGATSLTVPWTAHELAGRPGTERMPDRSNA